MTWLARRLQLLALLGLILRVTPPVAAWEDAGEGWQPTLLSSQAAEAPPTAPWLRSYLDFDSYRSSQRVADDEVLPREVAGSGALPPDPWEWQILPDGLIYRSYLAGVKEPRLQTEWTYIEQQGWYWEPTLGGRVGLIRLGDRDPFRPQGIQLDAEASAQPRLDIDESVDVVSVDFRGGLPLTFGFGRHATKVAYYHMSSHLGDEFLLKNPTYPRLNWSRDVLVLGHAIWLRPELRVYAEAGWAFYSDVSEQWEFQFGLDYAPPRSTGFRGAPFFAVNGHLREELNFGGNFTVQTGWAWRGDDHGELLRTGFQYYNGKSSQNSFYNHFEQQLTVGIWYDY